MLSIPSCAAAKVANRILGIVQGNKEKIELALCHWIRLCRAVPFSVFLLKQEKSLKEQEEHLALRRNLYAKWN